ncbi:SET and MYND domain-containing protein 4-like [Biomphalaria glabrata]|uniref:Protein-lysine N-methyltransferase SMYD4 n=1 Tax=Biomphalaria glabrata TaxID=6526 RepID=A0A9W3BI17_BIOGL|nr:SET and MYND domain-containing protein 4-like [Biomphalaria glabrata]XP_055899078.1 SET and MYND domain-containing protein 4-like [Biomphalaria glabrata]
MDQSQVARILTSLTDKLKSANIYNEFISDFGKCSTDHDRVACLYNLPQVQDLFLVEEKFKSKCKREAEILRGKGNERFKACDYAGAVEWYTQSIIKAPDDSENLSLAYNNRSTANFYLKNYAQSLQDIELAFMHNYPLKSCYKLYQRIGRCMYYLYRKEEAIKAFQQTIEALEMADMPKDSKSNIRSDMHKVIEQCSSIDSKMVNMPLKSYNCCHKGIPKLSKASMKIPCLSDCVEIRLDSYGGRGLFANRNIEVGEVLIVETPFASALLKEFNLSHCQFCCNRVKLPIPCKSCSGVIFCSLHCREAAWRKFHWAECHILENIQSDKGDLSLLATRMILTAGLEEIISIEESDKEVDILNAGMDKDGVYASDNYKSAYSLVNHSNDRTVADLLNRTISALYHLKYLEFVGFFGNADIKSKPTNIACEAEADCDPTSNSDETLHKKFCVGGHILRNIMMLPCNAHEVSEFALNESNPAMSATKELAAGVYPVLSLINHSCDPSVVRHSYGNLCIGRAIRSIAAGDELKDNYGALYPTMDLEKRQSTLHSQYFFKCSCEACQGDWPQYFDIQCDRPFFRCTGCDGHVPIPPGNLTEQARCIACGQQQDITQTLLRMGDMEEPYKQALTSVIDGGNSVSNITTLLSYLKFVEKHVHRPWRDINDCQEAFKQCLNMHANCYPA